LIIIKEEIFDKGWMAAPIDNMPRYVILDFAQIGGEETAADADVMKSARNLIARYLPAFQELAK
jgi:hypothetical protein